MNGTTEVAPSDWDDRYRDGHTPWDLARPHPMLTKRLANDPTLGLGKVGRALVPGCGRGWDAVALASVGWAVTAVDVSHRAVAHADQLLASRRGRAVVGDAFDWDEPVDLILDHTFFCAIDVGDRPQFGELCNRTVADDGGVVSIVFPIGRPVGSPSPPFPMVPEDMTRVLSPRFEIVEMGPERQIPGRTWPHRLCRWMCRSEPPR